MPTSAKSESRLMIDKDCSCRDDENLETEDETREGIMADF